MAFPLGLREIGDTPDILSFITGTFLLSIAGAFIVYGFLALNPVEDREFDTKFDWFKELNEEHYQDVEAVLDFLYERMFYNNVPEWLIEVEFAVTKRSLELEHANNSKLTKLQDEYLDIFLDSIYSRRIALPIVRM